MHPTATKDRLLNKVLANMMMSCDKQITPAQVTTLLSFKEDATQIDYAQAEYQKLLDFDLDRYVPDPSLSDE